MNECIIIIISIKNDTCSSFWRCCCGRLVRQHVGFTASLATKYSDVTSGDNSNLSMPELEEWSVEQHTEASPSDAYGVINFQGGSHSYRAKVGWQIPQNNLEGTLAVKNSWSGYKAHSVLCYCEHYSQTFYLVWYYGFTYITLIIINVLRWRTRVCHFSTKRRSAGRLCVVCLCEHAFLPSVGSMCVCPTTPGRRASCGWCWRSGIWSFQRSSSLSTAEFRTSSFTRASSRWWAKVSSKPRSPPEPGSSPEGSTQVCIQRGTVLGLTETGWRNKRLDQVKKNPLNVKVPNKNWA